MKNTCKTEELFQRREQLVPNALGILCRLSIQKAKGSILTDADGNEYIDFAGGVGALNLGHCPDAVVSAVKEQMDKFIHAMFNVAIYDQYFDLAERLIDLFPHGGKDNTKVLLTNSGTEAVENAVKIARQCTKRTGIVCFTQAFHGRTWMATSLSSKTTNKRGFAPLSSEVYRLPFPKYTLFKDVMTEEEFCARQIEDLYSFFKTNVAAEETAAIILELVQGEGGFQVFPKPYVQALRKLCDEFGIMLIFDEIQSGFGRTGKWGAHQHYGVVPDLSTWGKSLASGMPIACVIGKTDKMDAIHRITIGGTYMGSPVCAVAASATIDEMKRVDICALGEKVGQTARKRMEGYQKDFPNIIGEVRGLGAMMAFDIIADGNWRKSNLELTRKITAKCLERGLITITSGVDGNTIRMLSPLTIDQVTLDKGLDILEGVLKDFS